MGIPILGLETEYGLTPLCDRGTAEAAAVSVDAVIAQAAKRYPYLPSASGGGIFLGSGARLYRDLGHPEWATPEVDDPWELVVFALAGEETLCGLVGEVAAARGVNGAIVFKTNVDQTANATWACHENYGHRGDPERLPPQLIPHLVSRIVFSGAGGLNPFAPGIELCLSPRTYYLEYTVSPHSTYARGIYHTKSESLSGAGWHRLHLLCGESLGSHLGLWLKVGSTALLVALVEAGLTPGVGLELRDPVSAMQTFAGDVTLRATAELTSGRRLTALDLQWQYLQFVERHVGRPYLPAWAGAICQGWREVLGRLAEGITAVNTRLDWAIKHRVYTEWMRQRGFAAHEIAELNRTLAKLYARRAVHRPQPGEPPAARLAVTGRLHEFERLRSELAELEIRFGQLGPNGLFASLDRAGVLEHRLEAITPERVHTAMRSPPPRGRARVRGLAVQQLAGLGVHGCEWNAIWNRRTRDVLNLSDPLCPDAPAWTRPAPQPDTAPGWWAAARRAYDRGEYDEAWRNLLEIEALFGASPLLLESEYLDLRQRVQTRRGWHEEAIAALDRPTGDFVRIARMVSSLRFAGLAPAPEVWAWMKTADTLLLEGGSAPPADLFEYRVDKAAVLLHAGNPVAAHALLQATLAADRAIRHGSRIFARATAELAEVYRRLGEPDAAARCLDEAEQMQVSHDYWGDFADVTLTGRSKLAENRVDAIGFLDRAEWLQRMAVDRMGLARTLLLKARRMTDAADTERCHQEMVVLRGQTPALRHCRHLASILGAWSEWIGGHEITGAPGDYGGL